MKVFIVFNVGCIQSCVSSGLVGVFEDESEANDVAMNCNKHLNWSDGDQMSYKVFMFDFEDINKISSGYKMLLDEVFSHGN